MILWGVISTATATAQSFGGILAIRFFLGFVEAVYFVGCPPQAQPSAADVGQPGCLFFLSCWYTRKELGFRIALLYSGALISGAFSGLIAAGVVAHLDGARGLRAW
jgi:sugar phosphate permease